MMGRRNSQAIQANKEKGEIKNEMEVHCGQ